MISCGWVYQLAKKKTLYEPFVFRRLIIGIIGVNWSMLTRVCQSSGSGCSPNSSTHCSVQGRICPCKNGSMDTFTTCASPRSNNLPSSALNSDPFLSPTQDAGLPWPWALGVPKKKEAASSNGYTQTHCGPMVAWSTRFRCLYKT